MRVTCPYRALLDPIIPVSLAEDHILLNPVMLFSPSLFTACPLGPDTFVSTQVFSHRLPT